MWILSWDGVVVGSEGLGVFSSEQFPSRPPNGIFGICSGLDVWRELDFPTLLSSSGQAYVLEKILEAHIRAVAVKNRVDGEVCHPNSVIFIGGLQPFERVLTPV